MNNSVILDFNYSILLKKYSIIIFIFLIESYLSKILTKKKNYLIIRNIFSALLFWIFSPCMPKASKRQKAKCKLLTFSTHFSSFFVFSNDTLQKFYLVELSTILTISCNIFHKIQMKIQLYFVLFQMKFVKIIMSEKQAGLDIDALMSTTLISCTSLPQTLLNERPNEKAMTDLSKDLEDFYKYISPNPKLKTKQKKIFEQIAEIVSIQLKALPMICKYSIFKFGSAEWNLNTIDSDIDIGICIDNRCSDKNSDRPFIISFLRSLLPLFFQHFLVELKKK
ncbi:hypothetical protein RFI_22202 [Reticulomyxa filosa]|uniref:Poly(A) RNA polymerase mitochondrial-like central palm domain-containing protein n=1 Tax=Reticulomyxa filosa TaxID=46433 RepID=X6MMC1_RETFI|nr:hypothetical protein RFI_22202 [Reticulomyxa filosa]|eukprot:ETO15163.1 hypothetical protein RFI_22202 [Reticulomyxa filosa]